MADAIGKLRHQLKLATKVATRDSTYGGQEVTWTLSDWIFCSAEFLTAGSDEETTAKQKTNRTAVRFTIRHRDSLSTTQKIAFKGKYYEVESLLPNEDYTYLIIEAYQMGEYNTFTGAVVDGSWIDPNGDPWLTPDGDPWIVPDA